MHQTKFKGRLWQIPLLYALVGVLWIWGSDRYTFSLFEKLSGAEARQVLMYRGLVCVFLTALALYIILRWFFGRLIRAEKYYRLLYTASPIAILIADADDGKVISANPSAEREFGLTREQIRATRLQDLYQPAEEDLTPLHQAPSEELFVPAGTWRYQDANQREAFAKMYATSLTFYHKRSVLVGGLRITDQVQAQNSLNAYAHRLGEMQNNISDGYLLVGADWTLIKANRTIERIVGRGSDEIEGKNLWDVFPGARDLGLFERFRRAMGLKLGDHFEEFYPPLQLWLRISLYPDPLGLTAYLQDITHEKRQQERLAESERNLAAVINNTDDAIWYINTSNEIVFFNAAFQRIRAQLLLANTDERPRHAAADSVPEDIREQLRSYYAQALAGEHVRFEMAVQHKNGHQPTFEVSINPVRDTDGVVLGIGCIGRDITDRKRSENLIRSQYDRLRKIAWYQSHEVRGPVASILGLVLLFDPQNPTSEFNLDILNHLEKTARQLDAAVRSIVQEANELAP